MANYTEHYNLKKPAQGDFYDIGDHNGNADIIDKELYKHAENISGLASPEFDDSGEVEGITGFPDFLAKVKNKMNIFGFFRDFAAGMKFVLHAGQIVNNCMSDAENLPLAAKQGKVLMDLYTQLNGNLGSIKFISLSSSEEQYFGKPLELIKAKWETLRNEGVYLARVTCGSQFTFLIQKYVNHNYGSALMISYSKANPVFARLVNGVWSDDTLALNSDLATFGIPELAYISDDLHNINRPCLFSYEFNVLNNPVSDRGGTGICFFKNHEWVSLFVIPYNRSEIYMCSKISSGWSDWVLK